LANGKQQAGGLVLDVGQGEGDQFGASDAEAKPSRIMAASRTPMGVDLSMLAMICRMSDVGDGEWACLSARRGAGRCGANPGAPAGQPQQRRVIDGAHAVDVPDGTDSQKPFQGQHHIDPVDVIDVGQHRQLTVVPDDGYIILSNRPDEGGSVNGEPG